jgi:hypothetical protein
MEQTQPTLDKIFKPCSFEEMEATKKREVAATEEELCTVYFDQDSSTQRM